MENEQHCRAYTTTCEANADVEYGMALGCVHVVSRHYTVIISAGDTEMHLLWFWLNGIVARCHHRRRRTSHIVLVGDVISEYNRRMDMHDI